MAVLLAKRGRFQFPDVTGSFSVTGVGFRPSAVIFVGTRTSLGSGPNSYRGGFGVMADDGSISQWAYSRAADRDVAITQTRRNGSATRCIQGITGSGGVDLEAAAVSMDADGFTINVTNAGPSTQYWIEYLAIGGAACPWARAENFACGSSSVGVKAARTGYVGRGRALILASQGDTANGASTFDIMSVGITAEVGKRANGSGFSAHAVNPSDAKSYQSRGESLTSFSAAGVDWALDFVDWTSTGWQYQIVDAAGANDVIGTLVLGGSLRAAVASSVEPAVPGQVFTPLTFAPKALFGIGAGHPSESGVHDSGGFCLATHDGASQAAYGTFEVDNVSPTVMANYYDEDIFVRYLDPAGPTVVTEASVTLGSDGFTADYTTTSATGREMLVLALGDSDASEPELTGQVG